MKTRTLIPFLRFSNRLFLGAAILFLLTESIAAQPSIFTYNGRLSDNGQLANGNFQFAFKLFEVANGGTALATITDINTTVASGVFNVNLDFGATLFDGNPRYLEIGVRPQGSANPYTIFTTRQVITSVPYSLKSIKSTSAESLSCVSCVQDSNLNSVSGSKIVGTVANATTATNAANLGGQPASAYVLSGGSITANSLTLTSNGQIVAPRMENLAADPEAAGASNRGRIYYNTTTNELKMSNGTNWQVVGTNTTVINQVQPLRSPQQIATLGWWETPRTVTLTGFMRPRAMTFDGEFIYVVEDILNQGGAGLIVKVNPSTGAILNFESLFNPNIYRGLAFDGGNIWATTNELAGPSHNDGVVYRIKANAFGDLNEAGNPPKPFLFSTGSDTSVGVLFDGENIWTTWTDGRVIKLGISGTSLCNLTGLITPTNLAFDGTNVWIIQNASRLARISKNCEANPAVTLVAANLQNPYAIVFDGANLWVTNERINLPNTNSTVTKIRVSDGVVLGEYTVGKRPHGLAFDGTNIWVANWGSDNVTKLRATDGSLVGTYPVGTNPEGVVFDGLRIWVSNSGSNTLTRF